jgi:hypothetical protein
MPDASASALKLERTQVYLVDVAQLVQQRSSNISVCLFLIW